MMDRPLVIFVLALVVLSVAAHTAAYFARRRRALAREERDDFTVLLGATLTLLGLIIGFTFSMAVTRYDLRKNYEEEEANAIGTEYLRAGLLPQADAARMRGLLADYLNERLLFYVTRDEQRIGRINADTAKLQSDLWSIVQARAAAEPTPIVELVVSGMNDVINAQGYTQAAFWNRIPRAAWALMGLIAICCNVLFGYAARRRGMESRLLFVLPVVVAIAFFLIADLDAPRRGVIRVHPQNLSSLYGSLRPR